MLRSKNIKNKPLQTEHSSQWCQYLLPALLTRSLSLNQCCAKTKGLRGGGKPAGVEQKRKGSENGQQKEECIYTNCQAVYGWGMAQRERFLPPDLIKSELNFRNLAPKSCLLTATQVPWKQSHVHTYTHTK